MLKYRLSLGPVLVALVLGVLWLDEWLQTVPAPWRGADATLPRGIIVALVCLAAGAKAALELARLFRARGVAASGRMLIVSATLGLIVMSVTPEQIGALGGASLVASAAIVVWLVAVQRHSRVGSLAGATQAAGSALFAFVYVGLLLGFLVAIRREHSAWVLASVVLVTKACDIGAFFAGRSFGKHKMAPVTSPGKTWEGLVGGVVLAMLVSLATLTPLAGLHWGYALLVGAVLAVVGQAGDLLASMMKRDAAVKDSGSSVPGFGGVLDVIDSPLLAGPVAYWLLATA